MNLLKQLNKFQVRIFIVFILTYYYFNFYLFYKHFSIDILTNIEWFEFITLNLGDLFSLIIFIFFGFLLLITLGKEKECKNTTSIDKVFKDTTKLKLLKNHYNAHKYEIIIILIGALLIYLFKPEEIGKIFTIFVILYIIPITLLIVLFFFKERIEKYFQILNKNLILEFYFLFLAIIISAIFYKAKIDEVYNGKTKATFFYNDTKIETNNNILFVGQSKYYIFLYNKFKGESITFKKNEIDNLKFKKD